MCLIIAYIKELQKWYITIFKNTAMSPFVHNP